MLDIEEQLKNQMDNIKAINDLKLGPAIEAEKALRHEYELGNVTQLEFLDNTVDILKNKLAIAKEQKDLDEISIEQYRGIELALNQAENAVIAYYDEVEKKAKEAADAEIKAAEDAVNARIDGINELFTLSMRELGHRKKMGQFDDAQMEYLQEQYDLVTAQMEALNELKQDGLISETDMFGILEQQYEIQQAMNSLLIEENALTSEQIQQQRELLEARQQEILSGAADPLQVKELEDQIIANMVSWGATQEAIDAAKESFSQASYQKGTPYVMRDMVAQLHEGEAVLTAEENAARLSALNRDPFQEVERMVRIANQITETMRDYIAEREEKQAAAGAIFAPEVNIYGSTDPERTAELTIDGIRELHNEWHIENGSGNLR